MQPFSDSKPLTVQSQTPYKHFKNGRIWNQWLTLPVDYSTVPANAQLAITVWDLSPINPKGGDRGHHIPFGGTTISLFDDDGTLRTGRQKCRIWRHKAADGYSDTTTPWQEPRKRGRRGQPEEPVVVDGRQSRRDAELERLVGLMKKHEMGEIAESKWLDQMVFRQIEKLERQSVKDSTRPRGVTRSGGEPSSNGDETPEPLCADGDPDHVDGSFFLYIELPRFDYSVVFADHEYPPPPISSLHPPTPQGLTSVNFKPPPEVQLGPGIHQDPGGAGDTDGGAAGLIRIYDPEVGYADNPAESKHRRLVRGQRSALDRDLKPNPKTRDILNNIMSYGPTAELSDKEKDEVWRFRHHLTRDKRALTKLVKSVNWIEQVESRQAIALLSKWVEIDVDDALELLGPGVQNPAVRAYAVDRLRKADDEELLLYLIQLVQALKFEPQHAKDDDDETDSSLASFLIARSAANLKLGNFLHWYLMVELDDAAPNQSAANKKLFARVSYDFMKELALTPDGQARRSILLRQGEFITVLSKISKDIRNSRADRPRKIEHLKKLLADPKNEMLVFDPPLPLPLDPEIKIRGVIPSDANVFKSSLLPLYLNFKTSTAESYPLIFKTGDDLRQDQLVVQIIALMDRLLQKENLDLKLTPYRILATSTLAGAVQFIPSTPISNILSSAKYQNSILGFLRFHNPAAAGPSILGVRKDAMDTYVKSVAGYCVVTYLLGVGDRHLDNLMLAPDGHFFHIDFGYILGKDPKPLAPLMKLSREMIDGMGGSQPVSANPSGNSESQFEVFRQYCFTAYATLRRSSSLILNLFALMQDAHIEGLEFPGSAKDEVIRKVEERFKLDIGEEEAEIFLGQLIEREMGNWGGVLIDKLHGFTQGWRA